MTSSLELTICFCRLAINVSFYYYMMASTFLRPFIPLQLVSAEKFTRAKVLKAISKKVLHIVEVDNYQSTH